MAKAQLGPGPGLEPARDAQRRRGTARRRARIRGSRPSVVPSETLAATLHEATRAIALLVTSWGEPLDPLWREAVTEAIQRRAPWCLLFNGTHLRIVDAGRLFTRRYVEFDLDQTLDDPRAFAAFWTVMKRRLAPGPGQRLRSSRQRRVPLAQGRRACGIHRRSCGSGRTEGADG